ncbi:hypothetical protein RHMOL_Rhmol03G0032400 [Rhododendron molle]|uniref:Uncharacterized protein n=1 Tax=Rhododendron molle TaxID=49168 RepID=A0ACC0PBH6_RHOML|nr:hypothetical protein RHMOL_Rhmol03G0032400 [Rhododendron molle]
MEEIKEIGKISGPTAITGLLLLTSHNLNAIPRLPQQARIRLLNHRNGTRGAEEFPLFCTARLAPLFYTIGLAADARRSFLCLAP